MKNSSFRSFGRFLCAGLLAVAGLRASFVNAEVKVGDTAPDFEISDTNGKVQKLSDYKGKLVVLEWFNHECPFVKKHYNSNNMQSLQKKYTDQGVVWLSINSSAEGKQGSLNPAEANLLTEQKKAAPTAVLLDKEGKIGKSYGASTTPDMIVIDKAGKVAYKGAIDDNPSPKPADVNDAKNYVAQALDELTAGKVVSEASTDPYGCGVKYAS
jgi:peroxiredoxin